MSKEKMFSIASLLLVLFSTQTEAFDYVREQFARIDQSADPCDNFYRHACPPGDYGWLPSERYEQVTQDLHKQQKDRVWENLHFVKDLENVRVAEIPETLDEIIVQLFQSSCENGDDTSVILSKVEKILYPNGNCHAFKCLQPLAGDTNCTRAAADLLYRIDNMGGTEDMIDFLKVRHHGLISSIRTVNAILDAGLIGGISLINEMRRAMIENLVDKIKETPWVQRNGVEAAIETVASSIYLADNIGLELRDNIQALMAIELDYLKCLADIGEEELLCLFYAYSLNQKHKTWDNFNSFFNAANGHPVILFGFPLFHMAQNVESMAAKLGGVGQVVGHEISHTLIEDPESKFLLPVSSKEAVQCIQDQFNNTCTEFEEESCYVDNNQIDENGSDILGLQLAYQLFETYYGETAQNEYIRLNHMNITNQQLFFYANAFNFCSGKMGRSNFGDPHSVNNIRSNAVAQHPAFQQAFNCPDDSRMMRTVSKQCIIYGEGAPETRKFKNIH
ncbi:unnamed protein product [Caenorhabditis sp. 36 PRJEB53466]|nr:unnamed protein product [Caenorhabditis sp. 36 PRJEB53466]